MTASPALPSASGSVAQAPEACPDIDLRTLSGAPLQLTGRWRSPDGGTYFLRQVGSCVWFGGFSGDTESPGGLESDWTNSFFGHLESDFTLRGSWADLPWGDDDGVGVLNWRITFAEVDGEEAVTLEVIEVTGGFGGRFLASPETEEELVAQLQEGEGCLAVVTDDGTEYELIPPQGWSPVAPAGLAGPDGELLTAPDSVVIHGEVARGTGECGPGRIIFADQIEASVNP